MRRVEVRVGDGEDRDAPAGESPADPGDHAGDRRRRDRESAGEGGGEGGRGVGERRQEERQEAAAGEAPRRRLGHGEGDHAVGRKRQVRPVGLDGADRQERHRPRAVEPLDLPPGQLGEADEGTSGGGHRPARTARC